MPGMKGTLLINENNLGTMKTLSIELTNSESAERKKQSESGEPGNIEGQEKKSGRYDPIWAALQTSGGYLPRRNREDFVEKGTTMNRSSVLKLLVAVFFLTSFPAQGYALTSDPVFDKVKDSIVVAKTLDAQGKLKDPGNGVRLPSGKITTNCHVVEGGGSDPVGRGKQIAAATLYLEGGQNLNFALPVEWISEVKPGRKTVAKGDSQAEWLKRAIALEQVKDWHGMFDWCRKWTKSEPKNADAWYKLGIAYGNLKRYNDAIEAYRQALRINPEHADAWYNLGIAYAELNRYDDAIEAYRQALRINPEYADAWYNLGVAYANLKRYNDAIDACRQALRINPEYALAWYNLGVAYAGLKRYNDAIDACRQALRINPEDADAWYNLGVAYHLSGNRTAALDAVRKLRNIDPARGDRLYNLIVPR
jgi:tetratricopeptide (TPR) repeat protein